MRLVSSVLAFTLAAACSESTSSAPAGPDLASDLLRDLSPDATGDDIAAAAAGNTAFALDVYGAIRAEPGNLVFSPWSLSLALAMTYAGARGDTAAQMREVLHFALEDEAQHASLSAIDLALASRDEDGALGASGGPLRLDIASSLWGQEDYPFEGDFLDSLAIHYGAGLNTVNYRGDAEGARGEINDWVAERTEDRIPELLPAGVLTSLTRLVLTNTIYLDAAWKTPFDSGLTADADFHRLDGSVASVPTMDSGDAEFPYAEGDGFRAVELPYDGDQLSMVVIVPDDLPAFEAAVTPASLDALDFSSTAVVSLPKFDTSSALSLKDTLEALGMRDAFDEGGADFTGIASLEPLHISAVIHKGFITVSEKGTVAGAATGVVVGTDSEPFRLEVDRPFLFAIRDRPTGALLFLGRVVDPGA